MTQPASAIHPSPDEQVFGNIDPLEVLERCGRTFYAASLALPRGVRTDLAVLYAVCRAIDDSADAGGTAANALLEAIAAGLRGEHERSPVVNAFRSLATRHGVPITLAHQLIDGVRSDLGEVRVATLDELLRYSYRVASTVGLMMCRILDVPREGDPFAVDLGIAMQLTNISRDVAEDAAQGRVYLPGEWVPATDVLSATATGGNDAATPKVTASVQRLLAEADRYYESAELGMQFLPLSVRGGIRAAAWNYRAIGRAIRRDPTAPLKHRVSTSAAGKLSRTVAAVWASALESLPLGPSDAHDASLHGAVRSLHLSAT